MDLFLRTQTNKTSILECFSLEGGDMALTVEIGDPGGDGESRPHWL